MKPQTLKVLVKKKQELLLWGDCSLFSDKCFSYKPPNSQNLPFSTEAFWETSSNSDFCQNWDKYSCFLFSAWISCFCTCFSMSIKWDKNWWYELRNACLEKQILVFQKHFNFQFSQHILRSLEISQISRNSEKTENVAPKTLISEANICSNICQIEMKRGWC